MVNTQDFVKTLSLQELGTVAKDALDIRSVELNRPGLQFVGYYEHFAFERPQVVGMAEMSYLEALPDDLRRERLEKFFSYPIPCVIICRGLMPAGEMAEIAAAHGVPIFVTEMVTTRFVVNAMNYLTHSLAPRTTLHGVLVDVYGMGVLITGESGVGKSEAALELVRRGHQLVADDVVDVCRINDNRLVGEAPETVRHFMEIRGIGIIDIKAMYGISAVLMTKSIDMVIHLEAWKEKKSYDRLGLTEDFTTIMDVRVPQLVLPVRPGRNLAVVIEVAARNFSLKRLGYSAARELDRRLNEIMAGGKK